VVTFTSPASGAFTVGHGLGVAPAFVITKATAVANNWNSYHASLGNSVSINLNQADLASTGSTNWNSTSPTSSVFSFGSGFAGSNPLLMYCFAPIAGYSAIGSYSGNGSSDGPFVYTGFKPKYLIVKRSDASYGWWIFDGTRSPRNAIDKYLAADLSGAENTFNIMDFTSNGFKIRDGSQGWNGSGGTIIYMAFAENPFKYSLAR
jgi:hypothetical protein